MAENQMDADGAKAAPETESLKCPLCLAVFRNATLLTCGHTFCKPCLMKWDRTREDQDHMVCPVCREITPFHNGKRVDGLPPNVSLNALVDELTCSGRGVTAILESQQMCTSCKEGHGAISFCFTCDVYMCTVCTQSHKQMQALFAGHNVVDMKDIEEGRVHVHTAFDRCSEQHQRAPKDLFCKDCTIHVCLKCVVLSHRDHAIESQDEFEAKIQEKVQYLTQCCESQKANIEKNICQNELERQEVHCVMKKLKRSIKDCHDVKARQMKNNELALLDKVNTLQTELCGKLDGLKAVHRQQIKQMGCMLELVQHSRLGELEKDSLVAHKQVCTDLKNYLARPVDKNSATRIRDTAQKMTFHPAERELLAIGQLEINRNNALTTDPLFLGVDKTLTILQQVELPQWMYGMTALSTERVAIGYGWYRHGSDAFSLSGEREEHLGAEVGPVWDIASLGDRKSVFSHSKGEIKVYHHNKQLVQSLLTKKVDYYFKLCTDAKHIYSVNGTNKIQKISSSRNRSNNTTRALVPLLRMGSISTGLANPRQICIIGKSGMIITSNDESSPHMITIFDPEGNETCSLERTDLDEYLYAAVDSEDRVFIARVTSTSLALSAYSLEDQKLVKETRFKELKLPDLYPWWCYMTCLSPHLLAFASNKQLYFIKLPA